MNSVNLRYPQTVAFRVISVISLDEKLRSQLHQELFTQQKRAKGWLVLKIYFCWSCKLIMLRKTVIIRDFSHKSTDFWLFWRDWLPRYSYYRSSVVFIPRDWNFKCARTLFCFFCLSPWIFFTLYTLTSVGMFSTLF